MTKWELNEEARKIKWKYGIYKYVYKTEEQEAIKNHLNMCINKFFPEAKLEYFT